MRGTKGCRTMPETHLPPDLDLDLAGDVLDADDAETPATAYLDAALREANRLLHVPGTALLVRRRGRWHVVAASDPAALDAERAQMVTQSGPGVEAATHAVACPVEDLGSAGARRRWPEYVPLALARGIRSVAGVPMHAEGRLIGALDLLDHRPHAWTGDQLAPAEALADLTGSVVLLAVRMRGEHRRAEQLSRALDSRVLIEQAKGVIACSRGIDVDSAFRVLRKFARDRNAKLQQVAAAVVTLGLRP